MSTKLFNYFKEFDIFARLLHFRTNKGNSGNASPLTMVIDVDEKGVELWRTINQEKSLPVLPNTTGSVERDGKDHFFSWKYMKTVEMELRQKNFPKFLAVLKNIRLTDENCFAEFYWVSLFFHIKRLL